jgi:hypothetical protein
VRGFKEEGTTTTPFDMVVLNDLDRFHLVEDVIDRVPQLGARAAYFKQAIRDKLIEHKQYIESTARTCPRSTTGAGGGESAGRRGQLDRSRQRLADGGLSPRGEARSRRNCSSTRPKLEREYYARTPDLEDPAQRVAFGTSGHRGLVAARVVQRGAHPRDHAGDLRLPPRAAHRRPALPRQGHARALGALPSEPRSRSLPPNGVETVIQRDGGFTPTPVISHAILSTTAIAGSTSPTGSS